MKYVKSPQIEYLEIDSENAVLYDTQSGDTHYIDSVGKTVFSLLDKAIEVDRLISLLCGIYSAERQEIEADITEFLKDLAQKKVITEC